MKKIILLIIVLSMITFELLTGGIIRDTYNPFRMEYNKNELESFLNYHRDSKDSFIFYDVDEYYYLDYSPLLLPFDLKKIKIKKDLIEINTPLINARLNLVRECRDFIIFKEKEKYKESLKECIY